MKFINYYLIIILFCIFASCNKPIEKKESNFFFQIPESNIGITCSKQIGAKFYVMFSKDSTHLSESIDYLKYRTGDMCDVNLVFDPRHKDDVYIQETEYLKGANPIKINMHILDKKDFFSMFFDSCSYKKDSLILKYPFVFVGISPSSFGIYIKKYEINYKRIKEGSIYGGW